MLRKFIRALVAGKGTASVQPSAIEWQQALKVASLKRTRPFCDQTPAMDNDPPQARGSAQSQLPIPDSGKIVSIPRQSSDQSLNASRDLPSGSQQDPSPVSSSPKASPRAHPGDKHGWTALILASLGWLFSWLSWLWIPTVFYGIWSRRDRGGWSVVATGGLLLSAVLGLSTVWPQAQHLVDRVRPIPQAIFGSAVISRVLQPLWTIPAMEVEQTANYLSNARPRTPASNPRVPPAKQDVLNTSDPPGAEVWLDGKHVGVTPFQRVLSSGAYSGMLKSDGCIDKLFSFEVAEQEVKRDFRMQLSQERDLRGEWTGTYNNRRLTAHFDEQNHRGELLGIVKIGSDDQMVEYPVIGQVEWASRSIVLRNAELGLVFKGTQASEGSRAWNGSASHREGSNFECLWSIQR